MTQEAPEISEELLPPSTQNLLQKLLEQELKRPATQGQVSYSGALLGCLEGFDTKGYPIAVFDHDGKAYRRIARSTVELNRDCAGRECLIQLCGGPDTPIICGLIQPLLSETDRDDSAIIRTDERILLRCGDAHIELTAEGTVSIRGNYVESVAYGTHRIEGGSVKIN